MVVMLFAYRLSLTLSRVLEVGNSVSRGCSTIVGEDFVSYVGVFGV